MGMTSPPFSRLHVAWGRRERIPVLPHHAVQNPLPQEQSQHLVECLDRVSLKTLMLSNAIRGWGRGQDRATHVRLVEHILSGDAEQRERAMREHIRRGLQLELEAMGE